MAAPVTLLSGIGRAIDALSDRYQRSLDRADEALYRAKTAGRDRIEIAEAPPLALT